MFVCDLVVCSYCCLLYDCVLGFVYCCFGFGLCCFCLMFVACVFLLGMV